MAGYFYDNGFLKPTVLALKSSVPGYLGISNTMNGFVDRKRVG